MSRRDQEGYTAEDFEKRQNLAERLGARLKDRVLGSVFPRLAQGFLVDRQQRLRHRRPPHKAELADVFDGTLTLLYRLLFLLYAESRKLLTVHEACYPAINLQSVKEQIAGQAGVAARDIAARLDKAYSPRSTALYDRLAWLFRAVDPGNQLLNLPATHGNGRADFLQGHKVPDRYLAEAIDFLARDQNEKTLALVFTDYQSLAVRHLGSIYEGLLECELKMTGADETPPVKAKATGRREPADVVARECQVYLSHGKPERKASGSYYTPDPIIKYIVAHTIGPVLAKKLKSLRSEFRKACQTFDNESHSLKACLSSAEKSCFSEETGFLNREARQRAAARAYAAYKDLVDRLFDFKVLDPAMGSGHFLVEAANFITDRLHRFLSRFPHNPVAFVLDQARAGIIKSLAEQGLSMDPGQLTDRHLLQRQVLARCIHGVDLDPMAVELARMSLWLDARAIGAPIGFLDHHLRCGNPLTEPETCFGLRDTASGSGEWPAVSGEQPETTQHTHHSPLTTHHSPLTADAEPVAVGFDCVIGNPPYGVPLDRTTKKRVNALLPLTQSNADTAIAFLELGMRLLRANGRLGLIVPKPLTYSYRWRDARKFLCQRLRALVDVSRAWPDVLLEQVVVVAARAAQGRGYRRQTLTEGKFSKPRALSWKWFARYDTLPCALTETEQQLLEALKLHSLTLGDTCKTFRGLGLQRSIGESPGLPVIGGRDLERWRIRSVSGYVTGLEPEALARFQRPKLVFQNIIAHIARPSPHIALIGAYDPDHTLTLDTVNNIVPRAPGTDLLAVLALLHSEFINWFVYAVVYNKAIRTMHFDQYFLDKIPLPPSFEDLQKRLAPLARQSISAASRLAQGSSARERIDRLVAAAYGVAKFCDGIAFDGKSLVG